MENKEVSMTESVIMSGVTAESTPVSKNKANDDKMNPMSDNTNAVSNL